MRKSIGLGISELGLGALLMSANLDDHDFDHEAEERRMLAHLESCLANGERPLVDARDGAEVIAVCAACWQSIREHRPVEVTTEFRR